MKKLIVFLILIAFVPSIAWAVNTVTTNGKVIEISAIDSDWNPQASYNIFSITFVPGAISDACVIKNGSATGATLFHAISGDGEPRVQYYFGEGVVPFMDFSDGTFSSGAKVIILRD